MVVSSALVHRPGTLLAGLFFGVAVRGGARSSGFSPPSSFFFFFSCCVAAQAMEAAGKRTVVVIFGCSSSEEQRPPGAGVTAAAAAAMVSSSEPSGLVIYLLGPMMGLTQQRTQSSHGTIRLILLFEGRIFTTEERKGPRPPLILGQKKRKEVTGKKQQDQRLDTQEYG